MLLAYYDPDGRLVYAGRAGTGIKQAELERLWRRLQPLATSKMPLEVPPARTSRFGSPLVLSRVRTTSQTRYSPLCALADAHESKGIQNSPPIFGLFSQSPTRTRLSNGISRASIAAMTLSHKPECLNEAR